MKNTFENNENKILTIQEKLFIELDGSLQGWAIQNNCDLFTCPTNTFHFAVSEIFGELVKGKEWLAPVSPKRNQRHDHDKICLVYTAFRKLYQKYNKLYTLPIFCQCVGVSTFTIQKWHKDGLKVPLDYTNTIKGVSERNSNNIYNNIVTDISSVSSDSCISSSSSSEYILNSSYISLYNLLVEDCHLLADSKLVDTPLGLMAHVNAMYNYDNKGTRQIALYTNDHENTMTLDEIQSRYKALSDGEYTQILPFDELPTD